MAFWWQDNFNLRVSIESVIGIWCSQLRQTDTFQHRDMHVDYKLVIQIKTYIILDKIRNVIYIYFRFLYLKLPMVIIYLL